MVTLEDVARHAQVSTMTVSRVINNRSGVSEKTRTMVQRAIAELGYSTNMLARGLAIGRSGLIAYIVPDLADPYFSFVLSAAEEYALQMGCTVLFFGAANLTVLENSFQLVCTHKIDGVILHDLAPSKKVLETLEKNGIDYVLVESEENFEDRSTVDANPMYAGEKAAEILVRKGFAKLCCVHGTFTQKADNDANCPRQYTQRRIWRERTEGFIRGAERYGVEYELYEAGTDETGHRYLLGQRAAQNILRKYSTPLGVYCEDDMLALGFSGYALEHGCNMPKELSIIGTDGLEMCLTLYPRITTLVNPRRELVKAAIDKLMKMIDGDKEIEHIVLNPEIFWGDTTGK